MDYGIPALRADRLGSIIPGRTWTRYGRFQAPETFFLFRSARFGRRTGGVLGFYCDDYKLEALWTRREGYLKALVRQAWGTVLSPDFSLWADDPLAVQIWNVYRARTLARLWQDGGLNVTPSLSWAGKSSYSFCFAGIPRRAPVVFCQARTLRIEHRTAFLRGLAEAVGRLEPQNVVLYGTALWLEDAMLPPGPAYSRLPAVIDEIRDRMGAGA
jgi:hypothetical protein